MVWQGERNWSFFGSWSFLNDYFVRGQIKGLLDPMIFFDEGFERRFRVELKDRRDECLSQCVLEVVSNTYWAKWKKYDELEEIVLIYENEYSKLICVDYLEVESRVESK